MLAPLGRRTSIVIALFAATAYAASPASTRLKMGIPVFSQDSVTRDSTGRKLGALAGVVLDSASGSGLEGAQVLLRSPTVSNPRVAYTNKRDGFVMGKLEPGRYDLLVRRIGFLPFTGRSEVRAGVVDTPTFRIGAANLILSTTLCAPSRVPAPHYLTNAAADERAC